MHHIHSTPNDDTFLSPTLFSLLFCIHLDLPGFEYRFQEKLLLSLLPRFVALEIIKDIAEEEDHRKLLSAQFHKIYIHCYKDVR